MARVCPTTIATSVLLILMFWYVQMVPYKIVKADNGDAWVEVGFL